MSNPRVTTHVMEKNLAQARAVAVYKNQLSEFASENAKLLYVANASQKVEERRRAARHAAVELEHQYETRREEEAYTKRANQRAAIQNYALASEIDRENAEINRQKSEIQRICDDSPELRELERMLKVAYMNKERTVQHQQKIALAESEEARLQAMEDEIEVMQQKAQKAEAEKLQLRKIQSEKQRDILHRQIEERKQLLKEAEAQAEIDKAMVDDIVRSVNEEDAREIALKREKQEETARMMKEYARERQIELVQKRAAEKAEEDRILAYQRAVEARDAGVAEKKQAKKDEDDRILAQIVAESERKRKEEEEFNNLRDMLWEEELEEKRRQDAENRQQKQQRMVMDMMKANEQIKISKEEQRRQDILNEARLVAIMRKKFAEDEAKERSEEQARRDSKKHHISLIEKQRSDMKVIYEKERQEQIAEELEQNEREEYRKRVIQEARKRLLAEHAEKLQGYLPGPAFANREEYEIFQKAAASKR